LGVRPTEAGKAAAPHARTALAAVDALKESVAALSDALTGRLRVACPSFLADLILVPVVADLRREHPGLRIEILSDDRIIDLDVEGVDLAFRAGNPGVGGGKVRRIADIDVCLAATPEYLDLAGWPTGPDDLERLAYIQYNEDPDEASLALRGAGGVIEARVTPAFAARMAPLLLHAVRNHMGFVRVGRAIIAEDLASGRLVELLPESPALPKPLYLVTASAYVPSRRSAVLLERVQAIIARINV
jgi:DNA-binding transcriptional LysR family regulator